MCASLIIVIVEEYMHTNTHTHAQTQHTYIYDTYFDKGIMDQYSNFAEQNS